MTQSCSDLLEALAASRDPGIALSAANREHAESCPFCREQARAHATLALALGAEDRPDADPELALRVVAALETKHSPEHRRRRRLPALLAVWGLLLLAAAVLLARTLRPEASRAAVSVLATLALAGSLALPSRWAVAVLDRIGALWRAGALSG